MTLSADEIRDLRTSIVQLCEGQLADREGAGLKSLLNESAEARRIFVGYKALNALLELEVPTMEWADAADVSPPAPPVAPLPAIGSAWHGANNYLMTHELFTGYIVATVFFAIAILIASHVYVAQHRSLGVEYAGRHPSSPAPMPINRDMGPEIVSVGRITGMNDCVWINANDDPFHDRVVLGVKYMLKSGLMEITYYTGAKVILQGPCTYEVESTAGGYLSLGKLTARVESRSRLPDGTSRSRLPSGTQPTDHDDAKSRPAGGTYFAVRTPTAVVTDLGTEFAIEVDGRSGNTLSHVFQGHVTVRAVNAAGKAYGREVTLGKNQSAQVTVGGTAQDAIVVTTSDTASKANAQSFARKMPDADSDYAKVVLADKPLFYWTFDEPEGPAFEQVRRQSRQALRPKASASRCAHADIRSGLNLGRAADFTGDPTYFVTQELAHGQITGAWAIEFWAQFTERKGEQYLLNVGMATKSSDSTWGNPAPTANNPAVIFNWFEQAAKNELQLYCFTNGDHRTHEGPTIADGAWRHFLLVFYGDGEYLGVADRVDVVLDGRIKTVARGGFNAPFDLTHGFLVGAATEEILHPMRGRLDELAIYDLHRGQVPTESSIESGIIDMARRHIEAAKKVQE